MSLAYIILAHKNPELVYNLVSTLKHPDDWFFIHVDKKIDINPFKGLFEKSPFNVKFIEKREFGRWGDIGIVKATINGLYDLMESELHFSHVSLLSGQDYPIKPIAEIREFFSNNLDTSFIEYTPFPVPHLEYGGLHRIESYSFNMGKRRETYIPLKWKNKFNYKGKLQNLVLGTVCLFLPQRRKPFGWQAYYGSQWWTLSYEAVKCVLSTLIVYEEYLNYNKYSLLPDEMFFQTIILNNYDNHKLISNNYRYIDWSNKKSHPKELGENDFSQIKLSNALFLRKVSNSSIKLIEKINNEILNCHNNM